MLSAQTEVEVVRPEPVMLTSLPLSTVVNSIGVGDVSKIRIHYGEYKALGGKLESGVQRVVDGSIITRFDKTPFPEKQTDVVCPHFLELKWANGCNFDCAWCYLNGTLRFRPMKKKPYLKDTEKILKHVKAFLEKVETPSLLNSGELSDSLVYEGTADALTNDILTLFKAQSKHKLLLVTKSPNVKALLEANAQDVVVVSFSINAYPISDRWEHNTPSPKARLDAAKKLHDTGYEVRLRIDPIVPIEGYESMYCELVDEIFKRFTPERITLGSLRGLRSTINNCHDKTWTEFLDDSSNWGKKISFEKRRDSYRVIISYLKEKYGYESVGICKDTIEMWDALDMGYKNIVCNCLL